MVLNSLLPIENLVLNSVVSVDVLNLVLSSQGERGQDGPVGPKGEKGDKVNKIKLNPHCVSNHAAATESNLRPPCSVLAVIGSL